MAHLKAVCGVFSSRVYKHTRQEIKAPHAGAGELSGPF